MEQTASSSVVLALLHVEAISRSVHHHVDASRREGPEFAPLPSEGAGIDLRRGRRGVVFPDEPIGGPVDVEMRQDNATSDPDGEDENESAHHGGALSDHGSSPEAAKPS